MRFTLLLAALLLAVSSAAFGTLYDLGVGAAPAGMSGDGGVVAFNLGGTNIWSAASGSSSNLGSAYTTVGAAYTTYNAPGGKFVVAANNGGNVYRWDGTAAGVGTWSGPLKNTGGTNWVAYCIGADSTNVLIGGQTTTGGTAYRYKESSGFLTGLNSLSLPSGGSNGFVYDISDGGRYAGRYTINGIRAGVATYMGTGYALQGLYAYPSWGPTVQGSRAWAISRDGLWSGGWSYANQAGMGNGDGWNGVPIVWDNTLVGGTPPYMVPLMSGYSWGSIDCLNGDGSKGYGYQQTVRAAAKRGTAFVWDRATNTSTDLATYLAGFGIDTTGWTLTEVVDVSANGLTLTGFGLVDGVEHGWVVTIPEPGSILALATGLLGLIGLRRRTR